MDCPRCGSTNPNPTLRYDCGFDFSTYTMKKSLLNSTERTQTDSSNDPLAKKSGIRETSYDNASPWRRFSDRWGTGWLVLGWLFFSQRSSQTYSALDTTGALLQLLGFAGCIILYFYIRKRLLVKMDHYWAASLLAGIVFYGAFWVTPSMLGDTLSSDTAKTHLASNNEAYLPKPGRYVIRRRESDTNHLNRGLVPAKTDETQGNARDALKLYNLGIAKIDLGDYQGAIAYYTKAINLKPDFLEAFYSRGNAKSDLGDYKGAIADYTETINLKPDFLEAFYNRGNAKFALEDYKGAIADYTETINRHSHYTERTRRRLDFAQAFYNRGNAKGKLGDYGGGITDLTAAIKLNPNFFQAYTNRGALRSKLQDHRGAIIDHTKAIALKPDCEEAFYNRGNAKFKLGEYDGALTDLDKAIKLKPDDVEPYVNAGSIKGERGDYQGAIAYYTKAINLKPDFPVTYCNRGLMYLKLARKSDARNDFARAMELGYQVPSEVLNLCK